MPDENHRGYRIHHPAVFDPGFLSAGAVAAVFVGAVIAVSGVPFRFILRGMKPIAVILIITFIINMFMYPGTILVSAGPLKITEQGVRQAFFMAFRLLMLVFERPF